MGTDEIHKSAVQRQKRRLLMIVVLSMVVMGIIAASHQISKSIVMPVLRTSMEDHDESLSSDDEDDDAKEKGSNKNMLLSRRNKVVEQLRVPKLEQQTKVDSSFELPDKAQIGMEQVREILDVLPKGGNMLVWGLGNDSPFWHNVTGGNVMFLEDDFVEKKDGTQWFDFITHSYPFLDAYKVTYSTHLTKSWDVYHEHPELWDDHLMVKNIPEKLWNKWWDVILVDAPLGCCNAGPGRYQSIYTSLKIVERQQVKAKKNAKQAAKVVHIFVDDYERKVERDFSREVYKREPIKIVQREKAASNANEQAHFVFQMKQV